LFAAVTANLHSLSLIRPLLPVLFEKSSAMLSVSTCLKDEINMALTEF